MKFIKVKYNEDSKYKFEHNININIDKISFYSFGKTYRGKKEFIFINIKVHSDLFELIDQHNQERLLFDSMEQAENYIKELLC